MTTAAQRLKESSARFYTVLRGGKADRTPILANGDVAYAKYADPSVVTADFVERPIYAMDKAVEGIQKLKYFDGVGSVGVSPSMLSDLWMSKIRLPGRELGRDELWQLEEFGGIKEEDYDLILNKGWLAYKKYFLETFLGITEEDLMRNLQNMQLSAQKITEIGCAVTAHFFMPVIYDRLCSGRGMLNFARDMRRMPDKVRAVMDVMLDEEMVQATALLDQLRETLGEGNFIVFVQPGVRGNSDFISRQQFEKFNWPFFQREANAILKAGGNVFFHMDGNWNNFLDYFKEFPPGRCIFDTDGMTDIYKVKEILGDNMCITGNFSASLMAMASPDEVYATVKKQIEELGSGGGYIAATSCTMPPNAKPENMEAMVAAAVETKI